MNTILKKYYYILRPFIPIQIRWLIQRSAAKRIDGLSTDPMWPVPDMTPTKDAIKWPNHADCAFILTHDVDTSFGFSNIKTVAEVEKKLGLKSSWNIVPNLYRIDHDVIEYLLRSGMEIGVHDWNHDGKLFSDRKLYTERVNKINSTIKDWNAKGFRAGMAFHNDQWMQELECTYDSSYYDTDPYQPMGGGCRSIRPFQLGNLVELPYTMPQDHVLFVAQAVLKLPKVRKECHVPQRKIMDYIDDYANREMSVNKKDSTILIKGIDLWKLKAKWLVEKGGMILMLTHPDNLCHPKLRFDRKNALDYETSFIDHGWLRHTDWEIEDVRDRGIIDEKWYGSLLEQYAAFLSSFIRNFENRYWHCLPSEMAEWYRCN